MSLLDRRPNELAFVRSNPRPNVDFARQHMPYPIEECNSQEDLNESICSECNGDGEVSDECTECCGSGETEVDDYDHCDTCDCSTTEDCNECDGIGEVYVVCSECKGTGLNYE